MGGSSSKAQAPPVAPVNNHTSNDSDTYKVPGAGHSIVVMQDEALNDPKSRYRPASKEALAFRDATNSAGSDKLVAPMNASDRQAKVLVKDSRDYIIEHEGLVLGDEKKRQLAQQWWFALSSEPLQRGLDAGLITGAITAGALVALKKEYRKQPIRVGFFSVIGFSVGCMAVPLSVIYLDIKNAEKVRRRDQAKMQTQRDEFLSKRPPDGY